MYKIFFKRFFDIIFSLILIFIFSPILLLISIFLFFSNRGAGIIFIQVRPGKDGKSFNIIKFKTMTDEKDENGMLLPVGERITKTGRVIRSLSLDELPQLFNVLLGNMSMIGPRPLLVQYLSLYTKQQSRRHDVRPGITGWAQCNGRNAITWQQKFEFDIWYVDNISFRLDLRILLLTIMKIIRKEGVNSSNAATMETFNGEN